MIPLHISGVTVMRGDHAVLTDMDLTVKEGALVGVVGANGAGKTTLLRAALGLMPLAKGEVLLGGARLGDLSEPERARRAAYLPQERHVGWNMSAREIAALGAMDAAPDVAWQRAAWALERVGLAGMGYRGVLDMSGGERSRVLLARLFVSAAPLYVADEPAAGLDPDAQLLAMELFRDEADRGRSVLMTIHDLGLAARFCDRVVVLHHGRVAADAPAKLALTEAVLEAAFDLRGRIEQVSTGPVLAARRLHETPKRREEP